VDFSTWGENLVESLKEGIQAKLSDNWFTRTFEKIGGWFEKSYDIDSPPKCSKVMVEIWQMV